MTTYAGRWADYVKNGRLHAYGTSEGVKKSWLKRHHGMLHTKEFSVWFPRSRPKHVGQLLNGIPLRPAPAGFWARWKDIPEPPPPKAEGMTYFNKQGDEFGMKISSGCVITEPDGRVWLVRPSHGFGGYDHTFPKGTLEAKDGLTLQQNALKEVFEEAGLQVELTGVLGDFRGTTSITRYYTAKRVGGAPWAAHWETERVVLAPMKTAQRILNMPRDKEILKRIKP